MKRFPWRSVLYAVVLLYLVLDLQVFNGPLKRSFQERRDSTLSAAAANQWVALVNQEPITRELLDLAVFQYLYQRGREPADIPEENLAVIRRATLQRLIDDMLVRQYADGESFEADPAEIERFIAQWESQFPSPEDLAERSARQGLTPEEARTELARIWSRKRWIEARIAPGIKISDAEVKQWFEDNRESGDGFVEPEKIRARQIFLTTLEIESDVQEKLIREIRQQLVSDEATFAELAKEHSGDLRTKHRGGDLNWFARDRLPEDFTKPVFQLKPGELSEPIQTSIGWHLVEVTDHQPERPRTFEEMEQEIRLHLENELTIETVDKLIRKYRTAANIRLFPEHW